VRTGFLAEQGGTWTDSENQEWWVYSWTNSLKTLWANPVTTGEAPSGELSGELVWGEILKIQFHQNDDNLKSL